MACSCPYCSAGAASEDTYLACSVFSVTVIPPDVERINMNKCTWIFSLYSFPVLCTPFCCFCQLSVHQVTTPNHFLFFSAQRFSNSRCWTQEPFYTGDHNLQRENWLHHIGNAIFYASSTTHPQTLLYSLRFFNIFSNFFYKHHASLQSR